MGSFGERLRREREMRKISLDEIAAATKIGTRHLRALEDEEFKKLPGGIFNKGFVRAYARFLGINEDQAVSDYLAAAGEPENQTTEIMVDQLVAQHEAEKKVKARSRELETINRDQTGVPWGAMVALVLVIVAVGAGWTYYTRHKAQVEAERARQSQAEQTTPQPSETQVVNSAAAGQPQDTTSAATQVPSAQQSSTGTNQPTGTPVIASGTADGSLPASRKSATTAASSTPVLEPQTSPAAGDGFVVSIHATKRAWISVTADGKHVISGELTPADSKSFRAHSRVLLTTGNAGGVEISFNGKPIPPLGAEGEVRKATFTPEGIEQ